MSVWYEIQDLWQPYGDWEYGESENKKGLFRLHTEFLAEAQSSGQQENSWGVVHKGFFHPDRF